MSLINKKERSDNDNGIQCINNEGGGVNKIQLGRRKSSNLNDTHINLNFQKKNG